jgi:glutamine cyclotransferase
MGSFELLETVPSDASAFTQGLVIIVVEEDEDNNSTILLYEGTGLYGRSQMRQVDLPTGQVLQQHALPDAFFGEGIAYYTTAAGEGRLVQITWKEQTAFLYDSATLDLLSNFTYTTTTTEGWGITQRRTSSTSTMIVSDGSSNLHVWDEEWRENHRVPVLLKFEDGSAFPLSRLNELEWDPFTDTILANVWQNDDIVRIDPDTGFVIATYDLSALYPVRSANADVLNGIALVPNARDEVWVTGKRWPYMFRIRLV